MVEEYSNTACQDQRDKLLEGEGIHYIRADHTQLASHILEYLGNPVWHAYQVLEGSLELAGCSL